MKKEYNMILDYETLQKDFDGFQVINVDEPVGEFDEIFENLGKILNEIKDKGISELQNFKDHYSIQ